jgi:esterase, PHB depolymerase family
MRTHATKAAPRKAIQRVTIMLKLRTIYTPLLTILCACLLVACGGGGSGSSTSVPTAEPTVQPTVEPTAEPTAAPTALTAIEDFGGNPSDLAMHLYVPENLPNMAPVLLAVHYCTGDGPTFHRYTPYADVADTVGFIVIYPSATRSSKCFDVATPQALERDGGSDPVALRAMVNYVQTNYNVDNSRIYVTGVSSGAMMTNLMLALYPDVFAAGAAFAGVPYACFATGDSQEWSNACATGAVLNTPQAWGDLVRNANPSYNGPWPRVQLWHGTNDEVLDYNNFEEAVEQWTNVHGLALTPFDTTDQGNGVTLTRYGVTNDEALIEAYSMDGVSHNLPVDGMAALRFFGLD